MNKMLADAFTAAVTDMLDKYPSSREFIARNAKNTLEAAKLLNLPLAMDFLEDTLGLFECHGKIKLLVHS